MIVEVTRLSSWSNVLNAARITQRKPLLRKEPSIKFKKKIILAEHSPLRCLMFNIDLYNIPYYVSVHLCRHVHAQPFVSSARPDIDPSQKERSQQLKSDLVNMRIVLNAQEMINISKVRLCSKAETETRKVWREVVNKLSEIEPLLAEACVPSCIYRGLCPEYQSCGWNETDAYLNKYAKYLKTFDNHE